MERPYDPVSDKSEAREDWESVYAVSSPVPECAIWNLLNNDGELGMPLLSATDWLKFVVGRSKADQVVLSHMMTKVLLRARWADACCQKMFNGWQFAVLRGQVRERKLVDMTTACDAARRSGLRDKEALAEARNQSNELKEEMRSDVEVLTLSLQEAKDQVASLKVRLTTSKEKAAADKMRYDRQVVQFVGEKDALVVELKELRMEWAELNDALGSTHVEEARLGALKEELQKQLHVVTAVKEQDMVNMAKERRDKDAVINELELQNASKTTELIEAKAELTRMQSEFANSQTGTFARLTSSSPLVHPTHGTRQ